MEDFNDIKSHILITIKILKDKPLMLIEKDDSYALIVNYLEGYLDGISQFLKRNLRTEITAWYLSKLNIQSSYDWTGHIPHYYKGKTENELKIILLEFTEMYFTENDIMTPVSVK